MAKIYYGDENNLAVKIDIGEGGGGGGFTPSAVNLWINNLEKSIASPLFMLDDPSEQEWASVTSDNPEPDISFSAIKISDKWWKVYLTIDVFVGQKARITSNSITSITVNLTGILNYIFSQKNMGTIDTNSAVVPGLISLGFRINGVAQGEDYGYWKNAVINNIAIEENPFDNLNECYCNGIDGCDGTHYITLDAYIPIV